MDFHERIAANAATVEAHLNAYLDTYEQQPVVDAMRYAVQGGKRMRAYMVYRKRGDVRYFNGTVDLACRCDRGSACIFLGT